MPTLNRRMILLTTVALATAAGFSRKAKADAPTPDELKTNLTPLGALRAGNADGTIPAWTGGYSILPAGYSPGDPRPVPFSDEQPVLSITAATAMQYQDKLAGGVMELFRRYPDFRVDIYPTHRTAIAPQYVYDFTYKNASTATISSDGNSISNVFGGTPFPIPTDGHQVVWNHLLAWKGTTIQSTVVNYTVASNGSQVLEARVDSFYQYPYYIPNRQASFDGFYQEFTTRITAPPYQAGGATLAMQPINPTIMAPRAWQYLAGQRRTRQAPQLQYDTPNYFTSGVGDFDEFEGYYGPLDEYDFKLIGKKELYVPYNMNKAWTVPATEQLTPNFFNPKYARWELHRVWVVEMTVKTGKRNVDARRVLYVDEDTWNILLCDIYDSSNTYWKFIFSIPVILADVPCMLGGTSTILYDFHAATYAMTDGLDASVHSPWQPVAELPDSYFTPGQLSALAGGE